MYQTAVIYSLSLFASSLPSSPHHSQAFSYFDSAEKSQLNSSSLLLLLIPLPFPSLLQNLLTHSLLSNFYNKLVGCKHRASEGLFYIGSHVCVLGQFIESVTFARCAFIFCIVEYRIGWIFRYRITGYLCNPDIYAFWPKKAILKCM